LIGCDRVSVGIRHGRKTTIEAVSGADVVEKASTHIRRMRDLFDAVIQWGEKLVFRGARDETLPPKVLEALDAYLAEQTPKLLVLLTLAFTVIPYPLKLDSPGKLAPLERYQVFAPQDGQVRDFLVNPNDELLPGTPVAVLHRNEWAEKITGLQKDRDSLLRQIE